MTEKKLRIRRRTSPAEAAEKIDNYAKEVEQKPKEESAARRDLNRIKEAIRQIQNYPDADLEIVGDELREAAEQIGGADRTIQDVLSDGSEE